MFKIPRVFHRNPLLFIIVVNLINKCFSCASYLLMKCIFFVKLNPRADCLLLQAELDAFFKVTMTFCRKRSPIVHSYYLGSSLFLRVHLIKDPGFYLSPTLSFKHHLNVTVGNILKILGFIKRNTTLFTSVPSNSYSALYVPSLDG